MPKFIFSSECPDPETLGPRTMYGKSMCATLYESTSCSSSAYMEVHNRESTSENSYVDTFGNSLVVREGCTLTGYKEKDYQGDQKDFTGVHADLSQDEGGWNNTILSYKCQCEFAPVDCIAQDEYTVINYCENPFDYSIACQNPDWFGVWIGSDISNGVNLTDTEAALIRSELHSQFISSMTMETDYNWVESDQFNTSLNLNGQGFWFVDEGWSMRIEQIQGRCGESIIFTEQYLVVKIH